MSCWKGRVAKLIEMRKAVEGAFLEGKTKGLVFDNLRGRLETCIQGEIWVEIHIWEAPV